MDYVNIVEPSRYESRMVITQYNLKINTIFLYKNYYFKVLQTSRKEMHYVLFIRHVDSWGNDINRQIFCKFYVGNKLEIYGVLPSFMESNENIEVPEYSFFHQTKKDKIKKYVCSSITYIDEEHKLISQMIDLDLQKQHELANHIHDKWIKLTNYE